AFGEVEALVTALIVLAASALLGRRLDATFWEWGKFQVITGLDAGRFLGKGALLHLLTAAAFPLRDRFAFIEAPDLPPALWGVAGCARGAHVLFLLAGVPAAHPRHEA